MDEANRLYDQREHDAAQEAALKVLERSPGNIRMLRIVVTTACMMGETDKAQRHWSELPERDREQMATRCGVSASRSASSGPLYSPRRPRVQSAAARRPASEPRKEERCP